MPGDTRVFPNPLATPLLDEAVPGGEAYDFHQKFPDYELSPLIDAPGIAATLGVGRVWVKDESSRFGLPAFKALGRPGPFIARCSHDWAGASNRGIRSMI